MGAAGGARGVRQVRLAADYDCHPVWVLGSDGVSDNVPPGELPVDRNLAEELERWGDAYDATLDRDDPMASGFPDPRDEAAFAERGAGLARELARQLGEAWRVTYYDPRLTEDVPYGPEE
ncbi:hypothetical protein AR457_13000 [Streptomyces agglomeratus]|uniref:hypothetical protein n=1 Tax=Streptomyces agglomeratus TaxID=285458 RepID=UPI000854173C|nr:hypothetical protein [Streptomyces agglomeratus]OEJ40722.1 hypothetical protein BGK70_23650 [Streptomyces agglomeratus]OEJ44897.1 hypothetical protein AR457_13000 [Streptomyces agglomeratus]